MDNLVERLRAAAAWDDSPWWWDAPDKTFGEDSPASLLLDAAAEIERLRSALPD